LIVAGYRFRVFSFSDRYYFASLARHFLCMDYIHVIHPTGQLESSCPKPLPAVLVISNKESTQRKCRPNRSPQNQNGVPSSLALTSAAAQLVRRKHSLRHARRKLPKSSLPPQLAQGGPKSKAPVFQARYKLLRKKRSYKPAFFGPSERCHFRRVAIRGCRRGCLRAF
jgi:hypothetical protein